MAPAQTPTRVDWSGEFRFVAGVDVGSTTIKAVVVSGDDGRVIWRDYRRHESRQHEMLREFLRRMENEAGIASGNCRIFVTGSGGHALASPIGARFVREVNAVALAVEKLHPEVQSVIELGGKDAKIIVFKTEPCSGRRRKIASMNDKCAGGTGAVIDKIQAKLKIPADQMPHLAYRGVRIHPVAGKCGVFAETDINGLQKQGLPPAELIASLFDSIVLQNLTVLTRGHTLLPRVLLLGGPNAFLRGMREAWQHNIPLMRGIQAQQYAARAAHPNLVEYAAREVWLSRNPEIIADPIPARVWSAASRRRIKLAQRRSQLRIGIPRVLSMYAYAPLFSAYLESLGVLAENIVYSEFTTSEMYRTGSTRGSIDPCFPSKIAIAHFHNLLFKQHERQSLDAIFFPMFDVLASPLVNARLYRHIGMCGVAKPEPAQTRRRTKTLAIPRRGRQRRMGRFWPQPFGPGPIFPASLSLVARIHPVSVAPCSSNPEKSAPGDAHPYMSIQPRANNGCPTASITPETVEAAFTKETDLIAERGIQYIHPLVNLSHRKLFARQMLQAWGPVLGLSKEENDRALAVGYREQEIYESGLRRRARQLLDQLEAEDRLGIVMLGRPYHHDPGINHEIMAQFQKLGYPIFSQSTLPIDEDLMERLFGDEIRIGVIDHALDITDVWKTAFSASSNQKLWAAKFTARHPNLVTIEFSSFKCGHDAPIYSAIEQIIERSGTPFFSFKDMDENRPAHSIQLRVETIDYFLKRYQEDRLHSKLSGKISFVK